MKRFHDFHEMIVLLPLVLCTVLTGCIRPSLSPTVIPPSEPKTQTASASDDRSLDIVLLSFQQGIALLANGKTEEARDLFENLRVRHPEVSVFHNNLGVAYKRLGLLQEAIASYEQAIAIQNGYPEAHYNLAIALREQGQFERAEEAYKAAIALSSDFSDAYYNLAVLYDLYLNKPAEAIGHYQSYLDIGGGNVEEIEIWIAGLKKRIEITEREP